MELYISDHPLDCLTCPANGNCELQDMAGVVGLREVRYGYDGREPPRRREGHEQPVLLVRPEQVHRLLALRARVRGGAGHLRADRAGPRLRQQDRAGPTNFLDSECVSCGACVQACPTATLMEKSIADAGPARPRGRDDLRLLRRRLLVPRRDEGQRGRAHGAAQGRQGEPRPFVREGALRVGLRDAPRSRQEADDPRARSPTRGAR
jgi:ferredoxin